MWRVSPIGILWMMLGWCAVVGLVAISSQSLWIDEGGSAIKAMQPGLDGWWGQMLEEHNSNMQLPLYLLLLWAWEKVAGHGEFALRLLNLPLLMGMVWALWMAFRDDLPRFIFASLFVTTNAFVWFYLNDARPYLLLAAASSVLFAALHHLAWAEPADKRWFPLLAAGCLAVSATSMLSLPWVGMCLVAIVIMRGPRFVWDCAVSFPVVSLLLGSGMALILAYYFWSLHIGAKAPSFGWNGLITLYIPYEMLGFSGLGPARNELRSEAAGNLMGLMFSHLWLILAAPWILFTLWALREWRAEGSCRIALYYGCLLVAPLTILVLAWKTDVRLLPRHLTPLFILIAFVFSAVAASAWRRGGALRVMVVALLSVALLSSLSLRFSPIYAKDDYRDATQIARQALQNGQSVVWAADLQTACFYGLDHLWPEREVPPNAPLQTFISATPQVLAKADVIIFTKPDLYDRKGAIRTAISSDGFIKAEHLSAFEVWRRPSH